MGGCVVYSSTFRLLSTHVHVQTRMNIMAPAHIRLSLNCPASIVLNFSGGGGRWGEKGGGGVEEI